MSTDTIGRIAAHPLFHRLVSQREGLALRLSALVLGAYYAFMLLVAFAPDTLAKPITEGSMLSWGWPIGAVIIIGSWLLTGVYVWRANGEFDALSQQIVREVSA